MRCCPICGGQPVGWRSLDRSERRYVVGCKNAWHAVLVFGDDGHEAWRVWDQNVEAPKEEDGK